MSNRLKNIGVGSLFAGILIFSVIKHSSSAIATGIGLLGAALIMVIAAFLSKNEPVVSKFDFYILLGTLCSIGVRYNDFIGWFSKSQLAYSMDTMNAVRIISLIVGLLLFAILLKAASGTNSVSAVLILRILSLIALGLGVSIFFLGRVDSRALIISLFFGVLCGILSACQQSNSDAFPHHARMGFFLMIAELACILILWMFPQYSLSEYTISGYLSAIAFPWYSVVIFSVALLAVAGIGLYFNNYECDEDTIFLVGSVGLIWVVKATVFFRFFLSEIAVPLYTVLWLAFTMAYIKRGKDEDGGFELKHVYWTLAAATIIVVSLFLINRGYTYLWAALLVGVPAALFMHNTAPGPARETVFRIVVLAVIAAAACMLLLQCGSSVKKIMLIVGMFVVAAAAMIMLNLGNKLGKKWLRGAKIALTMVFALLCLLTAIKADVGIKAEFAEPKGRSGSLVYDASSFKIETKPAKDSEIVDIRYVWADGISYDKSEIRSLGKTSPTLELEDNHLIIWVEDSNGVVSRRDYWFYNGKRW